MREERKAMVIPVDISFRFPTTVETYETNAADVPLVLPAIFDDRRRIRSPNAALGASTTIVLVRRLASLWVATRFAQVMCAALRRVSATIGSTLRLGLLG